jgi:spore maturation protein CgeB
LIDKPKAAIRVLNGVTRILVLGSSNYPDSMEWHVIDALRHMGIDARLFCANTTFTGVPGPLGRAAGKLLGLAVREPERIIEGRLLRTVADFSPQLVLVLLGNQYSPKTVQLVRAKCQAPIVCWCQDQLSTMGRQYVLGAHYDAVFTKDRYMQDIFSRMVRSTSFHYLPEACNPRVHRTVELAEDDKRKYGCDLMIAGNLYYYRQEILQQLTEFDLKMWGASTDWLVDRLGSRHQNRPVYGDEKARAVRAALICLNTLHYAEINSLNCRAFEIAGCGGFQLISSVPVLAEHFVPDLELVTFATVDELIEKARYYLRNPDKAGLIARTGQARAHRDHTYEKRLEQVITLVLGSNALPTTATSIH